MNETRKKASLSLFPAAAGRARSATAGAVLSAALGMLPLLQSGIAAAADDAFPSRPLRLISPFTPGGGNDTISRAIAKAVSEHIGQNMIVENRPGGATAVGMTYVAKAPPDGHTLIMTSSTFAINPTLNPKLSYGVKDFEPVSLIGSTPLLVTVNASLPAKNIPDLIAMAKAKPGQLFVGSASLASRLGIELLNMMADVKMVHVPYKGAALAATDLIADRVSLMFATTPTVLAHIKAGKLRAIAVTSSRRSALMPDLPTVAESSLKGYASSTWYGVIAPAGTPVNVVQLLGSEFSRAVGDPEVQKRLGAVGIDLEGSTPGEFKAYVQSEIVKWAKVIKFAGVKGEE